MITIRPPEDGDGDDLVAVWDDVRDYYASLDPGSFRAPDPGHPLDPDEFVASLRRAEDDPARLARVADHDGRIVGLITAHLKDPVEDPEVEMLRDLGGLQAHIDALTVRRSSWRSGVGRALITEVEEWAASRGAHVLLLDTYHGSPVSVPFYEALGYDRQAIIFRKPLPTPTDPNTDRP